MRLRSLDKLNLERSWQRLLNRVRGDVMDVPDRLPFEVAARLWEGGPGFDSDYQVQPIQRVPATKPAQSTVRPFVRVHPADLLLYAALVDALRHPIETALGSPGEILGYRLSELQEDDPFESSPRWKDFTTARHQLALGEFDGYVIEGDVASYFLNIHIGELERRLLEQGGDSDVIRDLGALLSAWNAQGIRGLPQGIYPSSPLASFYLKPVDDLLRSRGVAFARYMDDLAIVVPTFHGARELLDVVEETLYEDGLSLGGGKTSISRSETVLIRLTPEEGIEEFIASLEEVGDYAPDEDEIEEVRVERVCEIFDEAVTALAEDEYRRSDFSFAYRQLARRGNAHAIEATPQVVLRMLGLTAVACRYLEALSGTDGATVAERLSEIIGREFHRAQEWLHLLRAAQVVDAGVLPEALPRLAELALQHDHPLVRARALLAWGRQSPPTDFEVADVYFAKEARRWLPYAFVAIQDKEQSDRDARYERWANEGRQLARLAEMIKASRFSWRRI